MATASQTVEEVKRARRPAGRVSTGTRSAATTMVRGAVGHTILTPDAQAKARHKAVSNASPPVNTRTTRTPLTGRIPTRGGARHLVPGRRLPEGCEHLGSKVRVTSHSEHGGGARDGVAGRYYTD